MKISKSAIFLFELMIVILVFTIAAAICTSIFAKGYQFSSQSENLTYAVINAESAAERFKMDPLTATNEAETYYNSNWEVVSDSKDAAFSMKLTPAVDGNLNTCEIEVFDEIRDESIFSIDVAKFLPN